jgi:bacterioferritin-associated ferredoxin
MYVCLCNGFTDKQVRALAPAADGSAASVYRSLGVRPKCGKCVPVVREILGETVEMLIGAPRSALAEGAD